LGRGPRGWVSNLGDVLLRGPRRDTTPPAIGRNDARPALQKEKGAPAGLSSRAQLRLSREFHLWENVGGWAADAFNASANPSSPPGASWRTSIGSPGATPTVVEVYRMSTVERGRGAAVRRDVSESARCEKIAKREPSARPRVESYVGRRGGAHAPPFAESPDGSISGDTFLPEGSSPGQDLNEDPDRLRRPPFATATGRISEGFLGAEAFRASRGRPRRCEREGGKTTRSPLSRPTPRRTPRAPGRRQDPAFPLARNEEPVLGIGPEGPGPTCAPRTGTCSDHVLVMGPSRTSDRPQIAGSLSAPIRPSEQRKRHERARTIPSPDRGLQRRTGGPAVVVIRGRTGRDSRGSPEQPSLSAARRDGCAILLRAR